MYGSPPARGQVEFAIYSLCLIAESIELSQAKTRLLAGTFRDKCLEMPAVVRVYNIGP